MKKNWIIIVFILTFALSLLFSMITNIISLKFGIIMTVLTIILVIGFGILFDIIGASSLTANEATFHSMGAKKIKGSKEAIKLIKNNDKVASICNDIIGDICGIISGGLGAVLAINISNKFNINVTFSTMLISAFVSALTVGGKAIFKGISIKYADRILYRISLIICFFKRK